MQLLLSLQCYLIPAAIISVKQAACTVRSMMELRKESNLRCGKGIRSGEIVISVILHQVVTAEFELRHVSGSQQNIMPFIQNDLHFTSIVPLTIISRASKPYVQIAIHPWVMQATEHLRWLVSLIQPSNILLGSSMYSLTFQTVSVGFHWNWLRIDLP